MTDLRNETTDRQNEPRETEPRPTEPRQGELSVVTEISSDGSCNLTHQLVRGWHLIVIRGDLGAAGLPILLRRLHDVEASGGKVIVDLARCTSVSTDCIEPLFTADRLVRRAGGELMLVVDGVAALQAIREAGFAGRFEIHRYVGDIVGAVPGLDEGGRGRRRDMTLRRSG